MKFLKNKLESTICDFSNKEMCKVLEVSVDLMKNIEDSLTLLKDKEYDDYMLLDSLEDMFNLNDYFILEDVINSGSAKSFTGDHLKCALFHIKTFCSNIDTYVSYYIPSGDKSKNNLIECMEIALANLANFIHSTYDISISISSDLEEVDFNLYNLYTNNYGEIVNMIDKIFKEYPAELSVFEANPELESPFYDALTLYTQEIQFLDFLLDKSLVTKLINSNITEEYLYKLLTKKAQEYSADKE